MRSWGQAVWCAGSSGRASPAPPSQPPHLPAAAGAPLHARGAAPVQLVNWTSVENRTEFVSLADHCRHKMLLHLPGNSYAGKRASICLPAWQAWEGLSKLGCIHACQPACPCLPLPALRLSRLHAGPLACATPPAHSHCCAAPASYCHPQPN
jgi:hypothetical protein